MYIYIYVYIYIYIHIGVYIYIYVCAHISCHSFILPKVHLVNLEPYQCLQNKRPLKKHTLRLSTPFPQISMFTK